MPLCRGSFFFLMQKYNKSVIHDNFLFVCLRKHFLFLTEINLIDFNQSAIILFS